MRPVGATLMVAIAATLILTACGSGSKHSNAMSSTGASSTMTLAKNEPGSAKILLFYPRDATVTEGESTVLCYGVSGAKSVRVDPPVDGVSPALNRCVEVRPKRTTHYTLIAEGSDGRTVSQSADIQIGADPATLPRITSFRIASCSKDYEGAPVYSLEFADVNAETVSIDPPVFRPLNQSINGQFYVKPAKITTYTLTVTGKNGHVATKQLTVDLSQCN